MSGQRTYSVVIPVYNGEAFIGRAIASCLQQTVLPNEIIVIDDASADMTRQAVNSINSSLVSYICNDVNKGASFSRNVGMKRAACSWILFLDADDSFHNRKIEIIDKVLDENPAIRAIGHSFELQNNATASQQRILAMGSPKRLSVFQLLLKNRLVTPSLAVAGSNDIFFDEKLYYAEDHDFILQTAEKYGIWYLDTPLCTLGRRPLSSGGLSGQKWQMRKGEINLFIKYCKRHGLYLLMPLFILFSLLKHLRNMFVFRTQASS
jgi:teichuronic acid biosynthesis glycosyltransferase TuaG